MDISSHLTAQDDDDKKGNLQKQKCSRKYSCNVVRYKILPEKNEEGQKRGTFVFFLVNLRSRVTLQ